MERRTRTACPAASAAFAAGGPLPMSRGFGNDSLCNTLRRSRQACGDMTVRRDIRSVPHMHVQQVQRGELKTALREHAPVRIGGGESVGSDANDTYGAGTSTITTTTATATTTMSDIEDNISGSDNGYEKNDAHPVLVLSFVTSNCRACRYASTGFARLAREFGQRRTSRAARFLQVDVSDARNQRLGQRLGVTAVPAFHLYAYKPATSDFSTTPSPSSATREKNDSHNHHDHSRNNSTRDGGGGAFGVLEELVGARVVGQVRDRLLHYCSDEFNLDDYVFEDAV